MNYFEVFELPQLLGIDTKTLEKKFHELSRRFHPDYFTTAPAEQKSRALRMTALLNDAYRTLRHATRRVEYLISIYGFKSDGSKVPQSLLMEIFEINEQLEELRLAGGDEARFDAIRQQIHAKRQAFEAELEVAVTEWDTLVNNGAAEADLKAHVAKLARILSESSYIRNLEDELENRQGHYFRKG